MKLLLYISLLTSLLHSEQYISILEWNIESNKKFLAFDEKSTTEILNTDVDIVVLNNVKKINTVSYYKHNKNNRHLVKNIDLDINTVFLVNKNITDHEISVYNNTDANQFENIPTALTFIKNNEKYIVINININQKNRQQSFFEINKLENIALYYSFKEKIDFNHIIFTGKFNIASKYIDNSPMSYFKSSNIENSFISENNLTNNYNNFIVSKRIKYKVQNYKSYIQEKNGVNISLYDFTIKNNNFLPIIGFFMISNDTMLESIEKRILNNELNYLK